MHFGLKMTKQTVFTTTYKRVNPNWKGLTLKNLRIVSCKQGCKREGENLLIYWKEQYKEQDIEKLNPLQFLDFFK